MDENIIITLTPAILREVTCVEELVVCQKCHVNEQMMTILGNHIMSYVLLQDYKRQHICQLFVGNVSAPFIDYCPSVCNGNSKLDDQVTLSVLQSKSAMMIELDIIVDDILNMKKMKAEAQYDKAKVQKICRGILYKVCVMPGFTVHVENTTVGQLSGIVYLHVVACDKQVGTNEQEVENSGYIITQDTKIVINRFVSKSRFMQCDQSQSTDIKCNLGGLTGVCEEIIDFMNVAFYYPHLENCNIQPSKGVLLRGPPGTGKTSLVKFVCQKCNAFLVSVNGPDIMGSRPGESEDNLEKIFNKILIQCEEGPCALFIDEIDTLCPKTRSCEGLQERRITAKVVRFLDSIQAMNLPFVVLAATNRPGAVDPLLRRPGRLDKEVQVI